MAPYVLLVVNAIETNHSLKSIVTNNYEIFTVF